MADLAEQELLIKLEAELLEDNKRLEECLDRYKGDPSEDDSTEDEGGEYEIPTEKSSKCMIYKLKEIRRIGYYSKSNL